MNLFIAQLSHCAFMITFCKHYIASLEAWMIGLWMDGLLDSCCKLWTAHSCCHKLYSFLVIVMKKDHYGTHLFFIHIYTQKEIVYCDLFPKIVLSKLN